MFLIFIVPSAFAQSMESNPEMFGKIPEQTILIEISANGDVHITHDVKHDTSIRFVEFVKGTTSNVEVHDSRSGCLLYTSDAADE